MLEARDRIGGRVHTKRLEGAAPEDGDELGAMWVHGSDDDDNPIAQVAAKLGLTLKTVSAGGAPAEFRAAMERVAGSPSALPRRTSTLGRSRRATMSSTATTFLAMESTRGADGG